MATHSWADGFGNWRVQFPTTGLDIVDHEYATQVIREALLERGAIGEDYIPPVAFVVSYRGMVEYMETVDTPVMV